MTQQPPINRSSEPNDPKAFGRFLAEALSADQGPIATVTTQKTASAPQQTFLVIKFTNGSKYTETIISEHHAYTSYIRILNYIRQHLYIGYLSKFQIEYESFCRKMQNLRIDVKDTSDIPSVAVEKWRGKRTSSENVDAFFDRVWGKYIPLGLTLAHVRNADPKLVEAIKNHKKAGLPWNAAEIPTQRSILKAKEEVFCAYGADTLTPSDLISVARKMYRTLKHG